MTDRDCILAELSDQELVIFWGRFRCYPTRIASQKTRLHAARGAKAAGLREAREAAREPVETGTDSFGLKWFGHIPVRFRGQVYKNALEASRQTGVGWRIVRAECERVSVEVFLTRRALAGRDAGAA